MIEIQMTKKRVSNFEFRISNLFVICDL